MNVDAHPPAAFNALFEASDDPWGFRGRWYESRKRALTLACLPRARYRSGYEPGCANGELSAVLAERCDTLLVTDAAPAAVALAASRLAATPQAHAAQAWLPEGWPKGQFDLIVVSELGYYLQDDALRQLARKARAALAPGGDIVACHWRHPIPGCQQDGQAVHAALSVALQLPSVWALMDPDFVLQVWSDDTRTVADREALVSGKPLG